MQIPDPHKSVSKQGFALVATISIMILLVMMALAMLSLSTIESRASRSQEAQMEAQANARLALMMALGELQLYAGPDQRITARANILDTSNDTSNKSTIYPHLTGVWGSRQWDPSASATPPNDLYEKVGANGTFLRYLASESNPTALEDHNFSFKVDDDDVPSTRDFTNPVNVAPGGIDNSNTPIKAGLIDCPTGGYAYTVIDQNVAADLSLRKKVVGTTADPIPMIDKVAYGSAAHRSGVNVITDLGAYTPDSVNLDKTTNSNQASLLFPNDPADPAAQAAQNTLAGLKHNITSGSLGLQTDVVRGGPKMDINSLLDLTTLPTDYITDIGDETSDDKDDNKLLFMPSWASAGDWRLPSIPNWQYIQDFYKVHKDMSPVAATSGGTANIPSIIRTTIDQPRLDMPRAMKWYSRVHDSRGLSYGLRYARQISSLPVVARVQLLMSTMVVNNTLRIYMDPVLTFWNPYNVATVIPKDLTLAIFPPPFNLEITVNDVIKNLTTIHDVDFNKRFSYFKIEIGRLSRHRSDVRFPSRLMPGQTMVFTGHNLVNDADNSEVGNLSHNGAKPGWHYKATSGSFTQKLHSNGGVISGTNETKVKIAIVLQTNPDSIPGALRPDFHVNIRDDNDAGASNGDFLAWSGGSTTRTQLSRYDLNSVYETTIDKRSLDIIDIKVDNTIALGLNNTTDPAREYTFSQLTTKTPFALFSIQLKPTESALFPNQMWAHSDPRSMQAFIPNPSLTEYAANPYEIEVTSLASGSRGSIPVETDPANDNTAFIGTSYSSATGLERLVHTEYPLAPITSLIQLRHLPSPYSAQGSPVRMLIGESFAHPLIPANATARSSPSADEEFVADRTYLGNHALFDHYFCSSMAEWSGAYLTEFGTAKTYKQRLDGFFNSTAPEPLHNSRYIPYSSSSPLTTPVNDLLSDVNPDNPSNTAYQKLAMHLQVKGMFNVNSTSEEAWAAVLNGLNGEDVETLNIIANTFGQDTLTGQPMHRYTVPNVDNASGNGGAITGIDDPQAWLGFRRLDQAQILDLAAKIVLEVKKRGPFLSMSEFINRRLVNGDDTLSNAGAIQAAIDATNINETLDAVQVTPTTGYENSYAAAGSKGRGLPGYLTQADVLSSLAPYISVRSDTFVIYGYGESKDKNKINARAWCQATVHRVPDYVDASSNAADTLVVDPQGVPLTNALTTINQNMGRRFRISSFRWMSESEIN